MSRPRVRTVWVFPTAALAACLALGCQEAPPASPAAATAPSASPGATAPAANAASPAAPASPATAASAADPAWPVIDRALGRHGAAHDDVYTFTFWRDDLRVSLDGMSIPTAAGIACVFHFYRCPCGKMNVSGQFAVTDYEMNDVVDALRHNATFIVSSTAPMFAYDKPRLMLVRFQGEGDPQTMAATIRDALRWTGPERMAPDAPDATHREN